MQRDALLQANFSPSAAATTTTQRYGKLIETGFASIFIFLLFSGFQFQF